jgi:hypothetical protein
MRAAYSLPLIIAAATALTLGACSRADDGHVAQAGQDLRAAGAATGDAADHLGAAAAHDARAADDAAAHATEKAQAKTGDALERAGKNLKDDARN